MCQENDLNVRKFYNNHKFYNKYLRKEALLDYWTLFLNKLTLNISSDSILVDIFEDIIPEEPVVSNIYVPKDNMGILIGTKKINIKRLERSTNTKITYSKTTEIIDNIEKCKVTVRGKKSLVFLAFEKIKQIGYKVSR